MSTTVAHRWLVIALAVAGVAAPVTLAADEGAEPCPELPAVLAREPAVKDPVFSVLVGLLEANSHGLLGLERLERELGNDAARSRLPYRRLRELCRRPAPGGALVALRFVAALDMPIPYSILGYHPGRVRASESCAFREWFLGRFGVPHAGKTGVETLDVQDVHVFSLTGGRLRVDIDWWLDALLGSALDDTDVEAVVVLRYQGRWLGLAIGHNRDGEPRSGTFDFAADRIVFPSTPELKTIARQMRREVEMRVSTERP